MPERILGGVVRMRDALIPLIGGWIELFDPAEERFAIPGMFQERIAVAHRLSFPMNDSAPILSRRKKPATKYSSGIKRKYGENLGEKADEEHLAEA
ncbi:MAG TPA: hypothetical protein VLB83_02790 [Candidatus Paceibacterota bacterium]|nr:hypothetical protein [Candidatus Paceibacterota bacterium]